MITPLGFKISEYQQAILNELDSTNNNILVNAKAGSGKTSTLLLIANNIISKNKKCLFLAFNKSIVDELSHKIQDDNCLIMTLHSLGYKYLQSYLFRKHSVDKSGYKLEIDERRDSSLVRQFFNILCKDSFEQANCELEKEALNDLQNELISAIIKCYNHVRLNVLNYHDYKQVVTFYEKLCPVLASAEKYGISEYYKVIENAIDQDKYEFEHPSQDPFDKKYIYSIDFTDMIYFPCYYNDMSIPSKVRNYLDYILVDECQDLSLLQQKFINLLCLDNNYNFNNRTRYVFVGDNRQAIYRFAGADSNSIENIRRNFILTELPLNICYRCPENVVKLAQTIVPEIDWNHERKDIGTVKCIDPNQVIKLAQPNDIIMARTNRILVSWYKRFCIDNKKPVKFKNKALVNQIIADIKLTINTYLRLYNKEANIEVELYEWMSTNNISRFKRDRSNEQQKQVEQKVVDIVNNRKLNSSKLLNTKNPSVSYLLDAMQEFKTKGAYQYITERTKDKVLVNCKEYYDIILSFVSAFKSLNLYTVQSFTQYLFSFLGGNLNADVPILSSVHSMKGSESDNVFILEYPKMPYKWSEDEEEENTQEENLQYVAITRAKSMLYLSDCELEFGGNPKSIEETNRACHERISELYYGPELE